jgi:hypothetical protein
MFRIALDAQLQDREPGIETTAMWKMCPLLLSALLGSCAPYLCFERETAASGSSGEIVAENISRLVGNGEYDSNMRSGDSYLHLLMPAIPYEITELYFYSLADILTEPETLDKAFRFSALTGTLFECDSLPRKAISSLTDLLEKRHLADKNIDFLSSPTYNSMFYPCFPNPPVWGEDNIWADFFTLSAIDDSITVKGKVVKFAMPRYTLSMSLARVNIYREEKIKQSLTAGNKRMAIATTIFLAKDLQFVRYTGKRQVMYHRRNHKITVGGTPVETFRQQGTAIIGFVYTIY